MSGNSGRGGRERQGNHQRDSRRNDVDLSASESGEDSQIPADPLAAAAVQRPFRPNVYVRWSTEKVLVVLQAIIDAPSRLHQTNKFDTANNVEGQPKTNLCRLECVFFCVFLVIASLFFCSYGDWKVVYEETAEFLSASPAFLALNKSKTIRMSTIKAKVGEWSTQVDDQRRGWNPSADYDDCQTHAQWIVLVIKLQKAKKASKVIIFIEI